MKNRLPLGYIVLLFLLTPLVSWSQQDSLYQSFRQEYDRRIQLSHINGRYIPTDLDDAIKTLDQIVDDTGKYKFKYQPEEVAVRKIHFSFGKWMIVNWGFYEGSRLSHFLKGKGISYPDDMAQVLMICFHRHLNQKPLEFDQLAKHYADTRKEEVLDRLLEGSTLETNPSNKN